MDSRANQNHAKNESKWLKNINLKKSFYVKTHLKVQHRGKLLTKKLLDQVDTRHFKTCAWPHQMKCTLLGHLFTHLSFSECLCYLKCDIYSRLCFDYEPNYFRLTGVLAFVTIFKGWSSQMSVKNIVSEEIWGHFYFLCSLKLKIKILENVFSNVNRMFTKSVT